MFRSKKNATMFRENSSTPSRALRNSTGKKLSGKLGASGKLAAGFPLPRLHPHDTYESAGRQADMQMRVCLLLAMSFAPGALSFLFGAAGPAPGNLPTLKLLCSGITAVAPVSSASPATSSQPPRKKRRHATPAELESVLTMTCCQGGCASKFADPKDRGHRLDVLAAERKRFVALGTDEPARKNFIIGRTPIEHNNKHKLYAGNQLVCGKFFKAVFPVSNNVIYAAKGTRGARASSNTRWAFCIPYAGNIVERCVQWQKQEYRT